MNIQKKKSNKAWNLLRLAFSSARKVAVLKRGLMVKGHGDKAPSDQIHYLERQLSFDRSPDFHVNKDRLTGSMRFLFPCLGTKTVEFHYDDDEDGGFQNNNYSPRESYFIEEEEEYEYNSSKNKSHLEEEEEEEEEEEYEYNSSKNKSHLEEEGIDSRAERFIADFYGQIRFGS